MKTPTFDLDKAAVTLTHINVREEKHGPEKVLAVDLACLMEGSNDLLAMLHPQLKSAFFKKDETPDIALVDDKKANALTALKFPLAPELAWNHEIVGGEFVVHHGLKNELRLTEIKIDKFVVTFKEGGRVAFTYPAKDRQY